MGGRATAVAAMSLAVLFLSTGLSLLAPRAAAFGERPYEANTVIGGGDPFLYVYNGETLAQSFNATDTYVLLNVTLRVKNTGSTTDPINITIRPDAGGWPAPSILAWSNPLWGGTIGLMNAALTPTPTLTRGATYWIVATKGANANDAYEWHHSNANTYLGGRAVLDVGAGWTNPLLPTDFWFLTYGRELDANVTIGMTVAPPRAVPKDIVTFTAYVNNSGTTPAGKVWVNDTPPVGLTYVSDTATGIGAITGYPNFTFANVTNGAWPFAITFRVDADVTPGSKLTNRADLAYTNATGGWKTGNSGAASLTIGLQGKQLYLVTGNPGPPQNLTAVPPGPSSVPVNYRIQKGGTAVDFVQDPPLARSFRIVGTTAVLFLDSNSHGVKNLDVNLTLMDVLGASQTPIAYEQTRVVTDNINGFQTFSYVFPEMEVSVATGHRILLRVKAMSSSSDDTLLATNASATPSRLNFDTSTYVRVDSVTLGDARGPATVWSPRDSLVVLANVSDPFGSSEIAGAWMNVTDPTGRAALTLAPLAAIASDSGTPSTWRLFEGVLSPVLRNGTYRIEVMVEEGNGVIAFAAASAVVRAPGFAVTIRATQPSAVGGDRIFYIVWYNNTGTGVAAQAWVNVTLPPELIYQTSSSEANRSSPTGWTFANVAPGSYFLLVETLVRTGLPPMPAIWTSVAVNASDEKGFQWAGPPASAAVILEGPVLSLAAFVSQPTIHANESFNATFDLANTGDAAGAVWLNLTLPSGLIYVADSAASHNGTSTVVGNSVAVRFPSMAPASSWPVIVTLRGAPGLPRGQDLRVAVGLNYTNAHGGIMPSQATTASVRSVAPALVNAVLDFSRSTADPGDILPATISFANVGDEPARTAQVLLTFSYPLTLFDATVPYVSSGNSAILTVGTVPVGPVTVGFRALVSHPSPDRATLSGAGGVAYADWIGGAMPLATLRSQNASVTAPVFTFTGTPTNPSVESGERVTYHVAPENVGSGTAGNVWLNASVPSDYTYVSDTATGQRTVVGGAIRWWWPNVGTASLAFDLVLEARGSVPDRTAANITASLAYADRNGNRAPDKSLTFTSTFVAPTIVLTLDVSEARVPVSSTFYYTLRVRNTGSMPAQTVWLVDSLDDSLRTFSYTASVPATGERDLNWTYRTLQPGEEQPVTLFVQVAAGTPVDAEVPNSITAVYTNSAGSAIGFAQSPAVVITVVATPSPWPYVGMAAAAAMAAVGVVVYWRRRFRIEEVFLVSSGGVLVDHISRSLATGRDADVMGAMFTAVQDFVRDAFKMGKDRRLHTMEFGDYRILIERGEHVWLAAVTSGGAGSVIARRLRKVVDEIEAGYGTVLSNWSGVVEEILGAKDLIRQRLLM